MFFPCCIRFFSLGGQKKNLFECRGQKNALFDPIVEERHFLFKKCKTYER